MGTVPTQNQGDAPERPKTADELLKEQSDQAAAKYQADLKGRDDLDAKEKKILALYDKGVHTFEIAKQVYDGMVNGDTVGKVVLTIRKQHADDFSEVEDVDSTRGYTGVSSSTSGQSTI